jgi:hypothetical protein
MYFAAPIFNLVVFFPAYILAAIIVGYRIDCANNSSHLPNAEVSLANILAGPWHPPFDFKSAELVLSRNHARRAFILGFGLWASPFALVLLADASITFRSNLRGLNIYAVWAVCITCVLAGLHLIQLGEEEFTRCNWETIQSGNGA